MLRSSSRYLPWAVNALGHPCVPWKECMCDTSLLTSAAPTPSAQRRTRSRQGHCAALASRDDGLGPSWTRPPHAAERLVSGCLGELSGASHRTGRQRDPDPYGRPLHAADEHDHRHGHLEHLDGDGDSASVSRRTHDASARRRRQLSPHRPNWNTAVAPVCRWSEGHWDFGPGQQQKWNEIQNTSNSIKLLSNYLLVQYKGLVWNKASASGRQLILA